MRRIASRLFSNKADAFERALEYQTRKNNANKVASSPEVSEAPAALEVDAASTRMGMLVWNEKSEAAQSAEYGMYDSESAFEIIANRRMREAISKGELEKLQGHGKPLKHNDATESIEHRILRNASFTPEWIDQGKTLRAAISRFYERHRAEGDSAALRTELTQLNRQLTAYNLTVPSGAFQIPRVEIPGH